MAFAISIDGTYGGKSLIQPNISTYPWEILEESLKVGDLTNNNESHAKSLLKSFRSMQFSREAPADQSRHLAKDKITRREGQ